ncbi:MAG: PAS domain-containing protein [Tateyamaria sp.]
MKLALENETGNADFLNEILDASRSFAYRCKNDEDVTMIYLTGSVAEITGHTPVQLLHNRDLNYASLCHPDDLRPMIDAVDAAIAQNTSWDLDYRLVRADKSVILVRERGAAVRNAAGDVEYLQGLVIDATNEYVLRSQLQDNMRATEQANREILDLARNIATSVRELSMLSINARIEAARAGNAGLGFSVVATEMGSLADKNAEWAAAIAEKMTA